MQRDHQDQVIFMFKVLTKKLSKLKHELCLKWCLLMKLLLRIENLKNSKYRLGQSISKLQ